MSYSAGGSSITLTIKVTNLTVYVTTKNKKLANKVYVLDVDSL
jgi:hypothetical protein